MVIGDVSGKGVKAAMLVSLIIGLLQKTTEESRQPLRILRELNRLLVGQTDGRFATCICALIAESGQVIVANAGHLSPYCGGKEMEVPGGLPLGLSPDATYEEVAFRVPAGERLTFLSDGVVEARSRSGELYGFDRTRTISIEPVQQIAAKAQEFGQEDDNTVVGIELQPAFG